MILSILSRFHEAVSISFKQISVLLSEKKRIESINLLRLSDAFMRQWNVASLVQIMACRLFGDNQFSEPVMVYWQLDPKEHFSMKFYLKFKSFHSRKCIWKCHLQKWRPSCIGLNVLRRYTCGTRAVHIWCNVSALHDNWYKLVRQIESYLHDIYINIWDNQTVCVPCPNVKIHFVITHYQFCNIVTWTACMYFVDIFQFM